MRYQARVRVYDDQPEQVLTLPGSVPEYHELWRSIEDLHRAGDVAAFEAAIRIWSLGSTYFMTRFVLSAGRYARDAFRNEALFDHPAHLRLANQLQFDPEINDTVVIGARGFGKTSIFIGDDVRFVLTDPNRSIVYFSLSKVLAKQRVALVREEFEKNPLLLTCFRDRLWQSVDERTGDSRITWSDDSIVIKRTTARMEKTLEAHSFEYQLPAGFHWDRRSYDDIEAERAVESEVTGETIERRWVSSQNLSSSMRQRRVTGTYYSASSMMVKLSKVYGLKVALYPGEDLSQPCDPEIAGPLGGRPVNGYTREHLWQRCKDEGGAEKDEQGNWRKTSNQVGLTSYARQTACDPMAGEAAKLDARLLRYYDGEPHRLPQVKTGNVVVCADCSPGMNDPTFIWVWLLTPNKDFVWVDGERMVLPPRARVELIHDVVSRWQNYGAVVVQLRVEQFSQAQYVQDQEDYWSDRPAFSAPVVIKCNDNRNPTKIRGEGKAWSIFDRWQPNLAAQKVVFPREMWRKDERGVPIDLVGWMINTEIRDFPQSPQDNGLDAGKLIWEDPKRAGVIPWPEERSDLWPGRMASAARSTSWQSAGVV